MWFFVKTILSGAIIAYASWLSGKKPVLAGFIIALPLMSMLSIIFSYLEHRDMQKTNLFAVSILTAVPLSLIFFLPFILNKWLKLTFFPTYLLGIGSLFIAYTLQMLIFKSAIK